MFAMTSFKIANNFYSEIFSGQCIPGSDDALALEDDGFLRAVNPARSPKGLGTMSEMTVFIIPISYLIRF